MNLIFRKVIYRPMHRVMCILFIYFVNVNDTNIFLNFSLKENVCAVCNLAIVNLTWNDFEIVRIPDCAHETFGLMSL